MTNISIEQGATYDDSFCYCDENEIPIDLTGYTAKSQIKLTPTGTLVADFICTIPNPTTGWIYRSLPVSVVNNLMLNTSRFDLPVKYWHDLILIDAGGRASKIVKGEAVIWAGATKI